MCSNQFRQASISSRVSIDCQAKQLVLLLVQSGFFRAICLGGDCCCLEAVCGSFSGGDQSLAGVVVSEGIDLVEAFDDPAALFFWLILLGPWCLAFWVLSLELGVIRGFSCTCSALPIVR
ncbi:hypothetical protein Ancab_019810 [Ancistrocladus abbreviatus]